jgi:hypothetical protein
MASSFRSTGFGQKTKFEGPAALSWRLGPIEHELVYEGSLFKIDHYLECAPDGGQIAGWELTGAAGLSEDESHGQAPHPQH